MTTENFNRPRPKSPEVNQRLAEAIEAMEANPSLVARLSGIDLSNMSKMVKSQITVSPKTIRAIGENTRISSDWLATGKGDMFKPYSEPKGGELKPRITNYANAGVPSEPIEQSVEEYKPKVKQLPDYDATIIVHGDSMEPTYHSGDEVAVKDITSSGFRQWGTPHILNTRQGILIKRIYPDEKGKGIKCVSDNKDYLPFTVPEEEIFNVYKIVGSIRTE